VDADEDVSLWSSCAGTGNSTNSMYVSWADPLPKIDTRDRSSAEQQALYKRRMITQTANLKSVRAQVMKHIKDSGCTRTRERILSVLAAAEARCI
jgi:hypothetical protein